LKTVLSSTRVRFLPLLSFPYLSATSWTEAKERM
jgi:hypothetical protein